MNDTMLDLEYLETWRDSEKSRVCLVRDRKSGELLVEKRLAGQLEVYRLLRDLRHPRLPRIVSLTVGENQTVVVEEYIRGGSIAAAHASEKQLLCWLTELCQVLDDLHGAGVVHRDVKPSNILIGPDGHIRLIDFDAARLSKAAADSDTRLLGTRGFAPPEQYGFAQTDGRADIYALGVTFTGLLGEAAQSPRWRGILRRCTAADPAKRYRRAGQIPRAYRSGLWRRRLLYPLLALALLAGGAALLLRPPAPSPAAENTAQTVSAAPEPAQESAPEFVPESTPEPAPEPSLAEYDGVWYASNADERSGFLRGVDSGVEGLQLELRTYSGKTWAYLSGNPWNGGEPMLWENDALLPVEAQGNDRWFIPCDPSALWGASGVTLSRSADGTLFIEAEGICTRMPLQTPETFLDGAYAKYDREASRYSMAAIEGTFSVFECEDALNNFFYGIWYPEDETMFARAYIREFRREGLLIMSLTGEPAYGYYTLRYRSAGAPDGPDRVMVYDGLALRWADEDDTNYIRWEQWDAAHPWTEETPP